MKLIATLGDISLFQTGYTTFYPEYEALTETFPAGHILDAEGKVIPVPNILSVLATQDWVVVADPDEPVGKGRKRQFASRAEAGRYAARIRWGNRGPDANGPSSVPSNPLPVASTNDINEAILTGAPYAPFLPENFPPELKAALDEIPKSDSVGSKGPASDKAEQMLSDYYLSHMDPAAYTPETLDALGKLSVHYRALTPEGNIYGRRDQADQMAEVMIKRVHERMYVTELIGEPEALAYTKGMVASPNKRVAVAVHADNLMSVLDGGFTTQFETGQSGGSYMPQYRAAYEAVTFGVHPATIPSRRPIYANLHPVGVQSTRTNRSDQYGEVQLVVKQSVHARTTFTVQDSLGSNRTPAAVNGPIKVGQASPTARKDMRRQSEHPADKPTKSANGESYSYAEAQIQQGLKVSDIAYVTIPKGKRLPAGAAARLKALGIPVKRTNGSEILDDASVAKSVDATIFLIMEAVGKAKAKSFNGDRSAAATYAAQVRWGKRDATTPAASSPAASYGETVIADETRVQSDGTSIRQSTFTFDDKNGEKMTMYVKSQGAEGQQNVEVELRQGGTNGLLVGSLTAYSDLDNDMGAKGKLAIQEVSVHSKHKRKGYATAMMRLGSQYSLGSEKIVHSSVLTDQGAAFAAATKARLLEKGRKRKFSSRAEAAAYAANIRWANNRGGEQPHMREMRLEAEALRLEVDALNGTVSFDNMKRTTLSITNPNNPKAWSDAKGDIQINAANNEMIPSQKVAALHDRVTALGGKMHKEAESRLNADIASGKVTTGEQAHAAYAGHMRDVVAEVRPVGGSIEIKPSGITSQKDFETVDASMKTVAATMPTDWSSASKGADLSVASDWQIDNGSFQPPRRGTPEPLISIPIQATLTKRGDKDMLGVVGHEYTHFVEYKRPAVRALEVAFTTHRTTGLTREHFDGTGGSSLSSRMRTTKREGRVAVQTPDGKMRFEIDKDSYANLYSGRRYDSAVKTVPPYKQENNTRSGYFEVMSTGMEQILNGNKGGFDNNHINFVLGVMATA
jgi:hypothetical protein